MVRAEDVCSSHVDAKARIRRWPTGLLDSKKAYVYSSKISAGGWVGEVRREGGEERAGEREGRREGRNEGDARACTRVHVCARVCLGVRGRGLAGVHTCARVFTRVHVGVGTWAGVVHMRAHTCTRVHASTHKHPQASWNVRAHLCTHVHACACTRV